jgi:hypothetical protein
MVSSHGCLTGIRKAFGRMSFFRRYKEGVFPTFSPVVSVLALLQFGNYPAEGVKNGDPFFSVRKIYEFE